MGKKVIFVTNSSHATREQYLKDLAEAELAEVSSHVVFPVAAVGQYLHRTGFKGRVHVVGDDVHREELRSWGLQVDDEIEYPRARYSYYNIKSHLKSDPEIKAVVVEFDPNLNYLKLMQAVVLLQNPECLFFSTATEKVLPPILNLRLIAIGYFADMIQEASGSSPIETGKPHPFMGELLVKSESLDIARTIMVGDSLDQDIGLGIALGMRTWHVPGEHKQPPHPTNKPTYFSPTIGHILPKLL